MSALARSRLKAGDIVFVPAASRPYPHLEMALVTQRRGDLFALRPARSEMFTTPTWVRGDLLVMPVPVEDLEAWWRDDR